MRKLDQKLIRDLLHMKGQTLAIALVIASGVATFVMSLCAYQSLSQSKEAFYREYRFADVFSSVRRAPRALLSKIESISGVSTVEARLVYDVALNIPEMVEPATARLISIPDAGQTKLNRVYVSRGRMLESERSGEVVVSEMFADAHGFVPGDKLRAILNGRRQELKIVGVALSPEYVLQIQPGSILPDQKRFGILWINQRDLESAFDMSGAFNHLSLKLTYSSKPEAVLEELDRQLAPYGSVGGYFRDQQISHQYLTEEIAQLRGMAVMAPAIFLSVSSFLLNIVVARIVSKQREQIAALKAFGYTNWDVGLHYANLVLLISLGATLVGTGLGIWMASALTKLYHQYYRFPELVLHIDVWAVGFVFLLTTSVALAGTWVSVRNAIRLPPAEAMHPEAPPSYRRSWFERMLPKQILSAETRMLIRNVMRKPINAALSVTGIAMAVAVMIIGSFTLDAVNYLMDFQFRKAQRQDLMVTFVEPATQSVTHEISGLPGVMHSELTRAVATRMRFENRSKRVSLSGLEALPELYRLLDTSEQPIEIPAFGVMLNTRLAEVLGVLPGDELTIEVLEGKRPTLTMEVTSIVEEYSGTNAYIHKPLLHQLLKESSVATGAFLRVDSTQLEATFRELEQRPGVASVAVKHAVIDSFEATMEKGVLVMRSFIAAFAAIIAIGVVYNSARIALSERSRDLATMRVIGFSKREVSTVLLGEIVVFTVLAIPLGWLLGWGLAAITVTGLDTDNYRIPLVINPSTFGLAALVVVLATIGSALIVQRRINQLDLIGVLKTRE